MGSVKSMEEMEPRFKSFQILRRKVQVGGKDFMWLSTCDLAIPNVYAMAIYAFASPGRPVTEQLCQGLTATLDVYPEWAGRMAPDNAAAVQLNDEGVAVIEAEMDCTLGDLMPFNPCPLLFQLVPATHSAQELLLIQVTSLRCGGIVLGIAWHHRLADGQAFFTFMDNWSRMTRGAPLACVPFRDRSALTARASVKPLKDDYMLLPAAPLPQTSNTARLSAKKLHFDAETLHSIKQKASPQGKVTTFEGLTSHLWRCITKARSLSPQVKTQIMIPMNGRGRLNPSLPESYFGNATFMPSSEGVEAGKLVTEPLVYAAKLVQNAIKKADDEYLRSAIDLMEVQNRNAEVNYSDVKVPTSMSPHVVVTSWVRFPLYQVDFGWGNPVYVGNVMDLFEGIMILLPSYTKDGSIDAVVALVEPEIEKLEEICYNLEDE